MQMVLVRIAPDPSAHIKVLNTQIATDILWAAAIPEDRLEHVRARPGPLAGDIDIAVFHKESGAETDTAVALGLCRRAIGSAPVLAGWHASPLTPAPHAMTWEIS